jgi:hypothetical protein
MHLFAMDAGGAEAGHEDRVANKKAVVLAALLSLPTRDVDRPPRCWPEPLFRPDGNCGCDGGRDSLN